jgi:hypothetical protein
MKNKILYLMIGMIFLMSIIPMASAESLGTFRNGDCVTLIQTCNNCTFANITSVIYPNSTVSLSDQDMTQTGTYFFYSYCDTSLNGIYIVTGLGDPDGEVAVWNYDFSITPNGEDASVGKAVFYIGLLIMLMIFLVGCVTLFMENDHLLAKVGFLGLGYLLTIAITFIAWNMANDFLLSAPFIVEMFRILFFVLIIGAFPLLIGAFAWYFIMLFKIKEIERLMGKGFSEDEARRRTSK